MFSISDISDLLSVAQILLTCVLALLVLYLRRWFVTRAEFDSFKTAAGAAGEDAGKRLTSQSERLTTAEARVQRVEDRVAEQPTAAAIANLRVTIEHLSGEIKVVTAELHGFKETMEPVRNLVDVLHQQALDRSGR